MNGREFEITSSWTRKLAMLNLLINGLESVLGEWGCSMLRVSYDSYGSKEVTICYEGCDGVPDDGFELNDAVDYGLIDNYEFKRCRHGVELNELYEDAASIAVKNLTSVLGTYVLKTRMSEIEYMGVVLQNGRAALLQGERDRVIIPQVKVSASMHTHPAGCFPSPHDIKSLINLLFDGGLGSGITSMDCTLFIVRKGPFTEDDLLALSSLRDDLSARDLDKAVNSLRTGSIGRNLKVMVSKR